MRAEHGTRVPDEDRRLYASGAPGPRGTSGGREMAPNLGGGYVGVRGVPDGRAAPKDNHLRRFVAHTGSGRDLLGQGALSANVYQERRNVRALPQEHFDLVQGRGAGGSGRAMLIEDGHVGAE